MRRGGTRTCGRVLELGAADFHDPDDPWKRDRREACSAPDRTKGSSLHPGHRIVFLFLADARIIFARSLLGRELNFCRPLTMRELVHRTRANRAFNAVFFLSLPLCLRYVVTKRGRGREREREDWTRLAYDVCNLMKMYNGCQKSFRANCSFLWI